MEKCKRCDKEGKAYQAFERITPTEHYNRKLSPYRCFCYFCDTCFAKVVLDHPEKVYMRIYSDEEIIAKHDRIVAKLNEMLEKGQIFWDVSHILEADGGL